ncbi:CRISPR-associated endonuclease Cas2 [Haladaptatus sp. F3-133]|uniref:CRISPR-associated endoribonuclease Cas2 n=1 Tax=Halorutilus salinus TaxID=2487751 RepID=A0A9Q4C554_9EURY|nr:CRISPR-associated endonuclease Cas2 [Halorutilus salinus]MCX2819386.1 CRISPR-associated endonuclease Cas2 [Halorutilus salinus]
MRLAIAYDVSDDSTRRRVYRTLESYGAWKQYSVFELDVTRTERVELEDRLESLLDDGDRVRIYQLCANCTDGITEIGEESEGEASNVI